MSAAYLDRASLEQALACAGDAPLLVAFSGGGDSTALLHLLVDALGPARVRAAVVDHALRQGSAADAALAAKRAEALGVAVDVLTLRWAPDAKRSQEAARQARYAALCAQARQRGAPVICVAHTRDDQAETVLLRAEAKSAWRGLAAMAAFAPAPLWPEGRALWLARPLLGVRRAALRALLRARDIDWIEDPANANASFARVRVRQRLAALEAAGFDPMKLAREAEALRPLVETVDADARALVAAAARIEDAAIEIDLTRWRASDPARQRALSALIAAAAGARREPRAAAVAALDARFGARFRGATLGGARLRAIKAGLRLERDPGALVGRRDGALGVAPCALPQAVEIVWDGRLAIRAREPGWRAEPAPRSSAPRLVNAAQSLALADAVNCDVVTAKWLVDAHVRHILAVHPAVTARVA